MLFLFYSDEEIIAYRMDHVVFRKNCVIAALNNGLDLDPIKLHRRQYSFSERDNSLLFIGRLTKKSELQVAFEALSLLGPKAPTLHVIGDGEEYDNLRIRAENLNISAKVVWHGGTTDEFLIASVANRCSAFIYPGQVGLSLIHGMAYGLPAIVHNLRSKHMPEIAAFQEGVTGVCFQRGNASSLANESEVLLVQSAKLERLASETSKIVGPSFSTEDMSYRFFALVSQLESKG